jgi:hypothetical protein
MLLTLKNSGKIFWPNISSLEDDIKLCCQVSGSWQVLLRIHTFTFRGMDKLFYPEDEGITHPKAQHRISEYLNPQQHHCEYLRTSFFFLSLSFCHFTYTIKEYRAINTMVLSIVFISAIFFNHNGLLSG